MVGRSDRWTEKVLDWISIVKYWSGRLMVVRVIVSRGAARVEKVVGSML